jgi:cellobiose-specific phosphotransferase system component IIC
MAADQGIIDSVSNGNLKTVAESAAFFTAQSFANSVQSQNRLQILAESALSTAIKGLQTVTPEQAMADSTVAASGLPPVISALLAALAAGQIGAKTGDNTPPMTGTQVPGK